MSQNILNYNSGALQEHPRTPSSSPYMWSITIQGRYKSTPRVGPYVEAAIELQFRGATRAPQTVYHSLAVPIHYNSGALQEHPNQFRHLNFEEGITIQGRYKSTPHGVVRPGVYLELQFRGATRAPHSPMVASSVSTHYNSGALQEHPRQYIVFCKQYNTIYCQNIIHYIQNFIIRSTLSLIKHIEIMTIMRSSKSLLNYQSPYRTSLPRLINYFNF